MKKIRLICYIFILILVVAKNYTIAQNYYFERLSIENGLSQNSIYAIAQDKKGFIWFGTFDGLNKYDGYEFKVYKSNMEIEDAIGDNIVISILKDKEQNLWIGTYSGLSKYNYESDNFLSFKHDKQNNNSLSNDIVRVLFQDKDGIIWIGTDGGLNSYDVTKNVFTRYIANNTPKSLSDNHVRAIYEDKAGNLWIGTYGGLDLFDRKTSTFIHFQHQSNNANSLSNNIVGCITEDEKGMLWIGTDRGLNKFDFEKKIFTRYQHQTNNAKSLSNNLVRALLMDKNGNLWIGTNGGINIYDNFNNNFKRINYEPDNINSLSSDKIWTLYEDQTGTIWIGTEGFGVNKYDEKTGKFLHFKKIVNTSNSLSNSAIWAFYQTPDNNLWIGTDYGLNKYNRITHQYSIFINSEKNSISSNLVKALAYDKNGFLWIGTDDGLNKMNIKSNHFVVFKNNPNNTNSLSDNIIKTIVAAKDGYIYVGTRSGGLNRLNPKDDKFERFLHNPDDANSLSHNRIWSLYEDTDGSIWVGTFGGGLNKFDAIKNTFVHYKHNGRDSTSISNNIIRSILRDKHGQLWIGTSNGLNLFDEKNARFKRFNALQGLPNNTIYAVIEDINNDLWISSNNGLSKYDRKQNKFLNYDVNDGLQSNEFNQGAAFINGEGELFFGGINGYNSFFPEKLKINNHVPPIVFTNFLLFNKPVEASGDKNAILKKNITETDEIKLRYWQNVITIEFTALNYCNTLKNQYKYKLENFDNTWTYSGNRRFATYTNLDPGTYYFKVVACNNDGVWNDEGKTLKIVITPPFWETTIFYIIVLTLILLLIYAYIKFRERKLRQENIVLDKKVKERTTQIEQQKQEIERQRDEIRAKNTSITDSIRYALKIQQALLPSMKKIAYYFPEFFIMYKPKDIVSGDFYWIDGYDDKIFFAAVDCTGHGVPGAFMSIIGFNLLDQAINKQKLTKPAEILKFINKGIIQTLQQHQVDAKIKDGMDIAFCTYHRDKKIIEYAGVYNPLFVIRSGELIEYKGNSHFIGEVTLSEAQKEFTNYEMQVQAGDMIYIFTDGYADQFGGPDKEKFMKKPFREKLTEVAALPLQQQKEILENTFDNWKGSYDQIDDVLIFGIKII